MCEIKNGEKKKRSAWLFDGILILALLALALSVFLVFRAVGGKGEGEAVARVTVNGESAGEYPLSADGEYELNGGTNILVIKDGRAYMKEATCPDRTCVTRHKNGIWRDGEMIICLPNRVSVEIYGGE